MLQALRESAPTVPESAIRMLQLVSDPQSTDDELLVAVRRNPELTEQVLLLSNSSLYNLPKEVVDVSQTVAYLGGRTLVRMVVALSACSLYAASTAADAWQHAIACGVAAQLLAERTGAVDPRCAFTAGVLHDIGETTLSPSRKPDSTEQLLDNAEISSRGFVRAERQVLGVDHCMAGASLVEQWRLPRPMVQAIRHHHDPEMVSEEELAAIVHVADALALQTGFGPGIEGLAYPLSVSAVRRVDLEPCELDRVRLLLLDEMQRAEDLLRLPRRLGPRAEA